MLLAPSCAIAAGDSVTDAHQRGVDLYKQQKYADAIPALEEAVKTEDPKSVEYKESVLLIGQSYFMLSQAPKAIPWLEKVPAVNEANYMLGLRLSSNQTAERVGSRVRALIRS